MLLSGLFLARKWANFGTNESSPPLYAGHYRSLGSGQDKSWSMLERRLTIRCEEAFKMEMLAVHW